MTATVPHQAIYRRWRAQTFAEIVGQTAVVETLRNAVRAERVSHAILFVGPRGTGKTSLARILAKALNCTDLRDGDACDACPSCVAIREGRALDLVEIDAASNRGIDAIRELRERINYAPTDLRRKVYILDEAHQITKDAWNALLKSLEEPPDFVVFLFASTHPQDFPPAILSRLQRYDVRRLTTTEIEGKLERILAAESITAEPAAVGLIARLAAGGMRDAESILDQVLASAGGRIDEARIRDLLGLAEAEVVERLLGALVDGDAAAGIALLDELEDRGRDVTAVLDQVIEALRSNLAAELASDPARATALAATGRRLASIDLDRRGVGGIRLQVELALLDGATTRVDRTAPAAARPAATRPTRTPAPTTEPPSTASTNGSSDSTGPEPAHADTPAAARVVASPGRNAADPSPPARAPVPPPPGDPPPTAPAAEAPPAGPIATPAVPAAASDATDGIGQLRARWAEIVAHLSQNPPTKPLIAACRPVSVEGNIVTLGFPEDQAFLKDALERRRPILEEGIGRVLGRAVSVRCVATNLEHVPAVPVDPAAADLLAEARRIFADDLADVGEVH